MAILAEQAGMAISAGSRGLRAKQGLWISAGVTLHCSSVKVASWCRYSSSETDGRITTIVLYS